MRQRIVRIGNSRGVRLPANVLAETRLAEGDEVDLTVEDGRIVLCPSRQLRAGWGEQFAEMARQGDDRLLDSDAVSTSTWDLTEWEW